MSYTFSKKRIRIRKSSDAAAMDEVLRKLRSFLDTKEPELVKILVNFWNNQGKAITYKEIREALLAGRISPELLEEWMQDYNRFVVQHLQPKWREAIEAGAADLAAKYPDWYFNPMSDGIKQWTEQRAAEFVTSVTDTQIEGIRAVVQNSAALNNLNVDQLARVIRPMVGLYKEQAEANLRYYTNLVENGMKEKKARDLALRYAGRQHRYRAMMIARQELAMAYNTGAHHAVKQAQEAGYMGKTVKVSCCADDERVCPICGKGGLDGAIVGVDEEFDIPNRGNYKFTKLHPPYHIKCRCGVLYKEIEPPSRK